ncbi:YwpF family protein [Bacillus marinisedimentorum]|uniref:YwpF family protein n=1 Tax=Bacillus marinisedimentorum TaxID=1821260 RepID=UPI0008733476|nr:YwpF family protein [Bacillus marinisedimentorum]
MKTFKLKSFFILSEEGTQSKLHEIPLVDGLIINREEANHRWLIEALALEEDVAHVINELEAGDLKVEVTITKRDNPPAAFVARLRSITKLEEHISVLLDAVMIQDKKDVSDILLGDLIEEGYTGDDLLEKFKKIKKDRGKEYREKLANYLQEK